MSRSRPGARVPALALTGSGRSQSAATLLPGGPIRIPPARPAPRVRGAGGACAAARLRRGRVGGREEVGGARVARAMAANEDQEVRGWGGGLRAPGRHLRAGAPPAPAVTLRRVWGGGGGGRGLGVCWWVTPCSARPADGAGGAALHLRRRRLLQGAQPRVLPVPGKAARGARFVQATPGPQKSDPKNQPLCVGALSCRSLNPDRLRALTVPRAACPAG